MTIFIGVGCFQKPLFAPRRTTIQGQVVNQVINKQDQTVHDQALADAVIKIIDPQSGQLIAHATTDQNGYYSISVLPGGPYVIQAEKENLRMTKVSPVIRKGETKNIQISDASMTAMALLFQELVKRGQAPDGIDMEAYASHQYFPDLVSSINAAYLSWKDPSKNKTVQNYLSLLLSQPTDGNLPNQDKLKTTQVASSASKKSVFSSLKLQLNNQSTAYALDFSENNSSTETHITITVPYGTDVSNLVATFTSSEGSTVTVGGKVQVSGVTPNDFSHPVEYVVTAQDGVTKKTYTVTVIVAPNTACDIINFGFVDPPVSVTVTPSQ